jgi:predicted GTPase
MYRRNVIIIGAAGRDFHNFNTYYRGNERYNVVGFTAAQIPGIEGRKYPPELAGDLYPEGIPIYAEENLPQLIKDLEVDECAFSYSDISYHHVMAVSAIVQAAGASYVLLGPNDTMLKSSKPVIGVGAVRTGSGKSQTSRKIIEILMEKGLDVVAIRHPMPYGDLASQKVQRFAELSDLEKHNCTIEEMEEYEPHIMRGNVIYSGVDYEAILKAAENDPQGCDLIVWDGGNNEPPFYVPDLQVTVADPLRAGDELSYYPGEVTLRIADIVIINKMDTAGIAEINKVRKNISAVNPEATIIEAVSVIDVDDPSVIKGKDVLVVEDGPTLTHGGMDIGAGVVAAKKFGAAKLVDPQPYTVGGLSETYQTYPDIGTLLPAMGYGDQMLKDLETTINNTECESVVIGTPVDLNRIIDIRHPTTRVFYELQEIGRLNLTGVMDAFLNKIS